MGVTACNWLLGIIVSNTCVLSRQNLHRCVCLSTGEILSGQVLSRSPIARGTPLPQTGVPLDKTGGNPTPGLVKYIKMICPVFLLFAFHHLQIVFEVFCAITLIARELTDNRYFTGRIIDVSMQMIIVSERKSFFSYSTQSYKDFSLYKVNEKSDPYLHCYSIANGLHS